MKKNTVIEWNRCYAIHVPPIDFQHQRLFALLNNLYKICGKKGESAGYPFATAVKEILYYFKHHFNVEEEIMEKTGYPDFVNHKNGHAVFFGIFLEQIKLFESGRQFVPGSLACFLRDWMLTHIRIDADIGVHLRKLENPNIFTHL